MISMSKLDMANYMRDYAMFLLYCARNPDKELSFNYIDFLNSEQKKVDDDEEYYHRMIRVYHSYVQFRHLSIVEDSLLNRDDFISNNNLEDLKQYCNIYSNDRDFTNKKLIQLVRNAFNHNDDDSFDRFIWSQNGKNFEINYNDIRTQREIDNGVLPKPVKIKFNIDFIFKLVKEMDEAGQNIFLYGINVPNDFDMYSNNLYDNLNQISFFRTYTPKKIPLDLLRDIKKNLFKDSYNKRMDILETQYDSRLLLHHSEDLSLDTRIYFLNDDQKRTIYQEIKKWTKRTDLINVKANIKCILNNCIEKAIPIPYLKKDYLVEQIIASYLFQYKNIFSINSLTKSICDVTMEEFNNNSINDELVFKQMKPMSHTKKIIFNQDFWNPDFILVFPCIMFVDCVITHLCNEENIIINGRAYNREKIRNSLVHMRWYLNASDKLVLYDADPRNVNDMNLEVAAKLPINALTEWAYDYVENLNKNKNKKL